MIHAITAADQSLLDRLSLQYSQQIEKGQIRPSLIIDYLVSGKLGSNDGWLIKKGNEGFEGLLKYRLIAQRKLEAISASPSFYFGQDAYYGNNASIPDLRKVPGFMDYRGSGDIAFILLMESFRRGAGTELVQALQKLGSIELIFTRSMAQAQGFYSKAGFVHSGILGGVERTHPTMVLVRP